MGAVAVKCICGHIIDSHRPGTGACGGEELGECICCCFERGKEETND